MRKISFLLFAISFAIGAYAQSCEEVADKLLNKLATTSLQTDFNISVTEPEAQSLNYSGNILMKGKAFRLYMASTQAYYNGTTLWVYDSDLDEINISKPTDEDLQETNPLLVIQLVRHNCRLHYSDTFKDQTQWSVDFYPNNKHSDVLKYTVQFHRNDLVPTRIIINEIHNRTTTVILSGQKYGVDTIGKFELDTKKYSDAIITDLR